MKLKNKKLNKKFKAPKIVIRDAVKFATDVIYPNQKAAKLEIIVIGQGSNLHQLSEYKKGSKFISESDKSKEYVVEEKNLLVNKPGYGQKKFIAIFKENGKSLEISKQPSRISAAVLYLADRSEALGQSIKELFGTHFSMKKILFFVLIGIVGAVIYFILTSGGVF